jgi:hypothetical protein
MNGIGNTETIDHLPTALNPDIHCLGHGKSGRIPIGGQGIRRNSHAGPTHAHGSRSDRDEFKSYGLRRYHEAHYDRKGKN